MTRLRPTGEADDFEHLDRDPRKLAANVPRGWNEPRHPDAAESVEFDDDGTPTRPARDYS